MRDREHFGYVPVSKTIGYAGHSVPNWPNVPFPADPAVSIYQRRGVAAGLGDRNNPAF
jgi:hypothetical protein